MCRTVQLILLITCVAVCGCQSSSTTLLGRPLPVQSPLLVDHLKPSRLPVVIEGTMVEKCPVAGCWFKVEDKSGIVKVDTKNAGFVVVSVPTGTKVRVAGTYQGDPEPLITATGMTY